MFTNICGEIVSFEIYSDQDGIWRNTSGSSDKADLRECGVVNDKVRGTQDPKGHKSVTFLAYLIHLLSIVIHLGNHHHPRLALPAPQAVALRALVHVLEARLQDGKI